MHISQIEPWTFFAKQNRKRKTIGTFNWKVYLYWFLNGLKIGVLCTRGWRPSKRYVADQKNLYKFCTNENKTTVWKMNDPLGFNSAIAFITLSVSSLDDLGWRWSWLIDAVWTWCRYRILDAKWSMRHSITLLSLIFAWTALSGFQSTGIPIFAQAALSGFRLAGCTDFFIFIPTFCPNPFGSPGSPNFCLGMST